MWDTIILSPFINALLFIYKVLGGNFALAIVLFTLLIRLITHPLMVSQIRGSQKMTDLQKDKRWLDVQEKYKGDKEKIQQEQAKLIQELGVNPLASCLPLLVQFPVIIGLYQAITATMAQAPVQLLSLTRHAYPGFLNIAALLPLNNKFLWMNLGQPERLNIPGIPWGIPVLTILVVITTYVQSKVSIPPTTGGKSAQDQQSAMMGNMMSIYMPLLMGWISYSLASGLAIYFLASNLIGIGQYALLGRVYWSNLIPGRKQTVEPTSVAPKITKKKSS
jgi:YidC/Oxa1 family membrane protein insertase